MTQRFGLGSRKTGVTGDGDISGIRGGMEKSGLEAGGMAGDRVILHIARL